MSETKNTLYDTLGHKAFSDFTTQAAAILAGSTGTIEERINAVVALEKGPNESEGDFLTRQAGILYTQSLSDAERIDQVIALEKQYTDATARGGR